MQPSFAKQPTASRIVPVERVSVTPADSLQLPQGGRMITEEDMHKERERWMQMCMHEVWKLENAAFGRIQQHTEEAAQKLKPAISAELMTLLQAEKAARTQEISELRSQLPSDTQGPRPWEAKVNEMGTEIAAFRRDLANGLTAISDLAKSHMTESEKAGANMVHTSEVAMLRSEIELLKEHQESRLAASTSDLKTALEGTKRCTETAQAQMAQEMGSLRSEVSSELSSLRSAMEATSVSDLRDLTRELSRRVDDTERKLVDLRQDQMSEIALLRGRVEEVLGEGAGHGTKLDVMQMVVKEEQGRRTADHCMMLSRLEALERANSVATKQEKATVAAAGAENTAIAQINSKLEEVERQLSSMGVGTCATQAATTASVTNSAEIAALRARIQEVEEVFVRNTFGNMKRQAKEEASTAQNDQLQKDLEQMRRDISRLSSDMNEERQERAKVFAEVGRITEDVSKAANATIEHAKRRFDQELQTGNLRASSTNASGVVASSRSNSAAPSAQRLESRERVPPNAGNEVEFGVGGNGLGSRGTAVGSLSDDARASLGGSSLARLVGEMDAELRVELSSRMRLLTAELRGEIFSEVAVKVASAEARVGVVETRLESEVHRVNAALSARVSKLEGLNFSARFDSVEAEVRRIAVVFSSSHQVERLRSMGKCSTQEPTTSFEAGFRDAVSGPPSPLGRWSDPYCKVPRSAAIRSQSPNLNTSRLPSDGSSGVAPETSAPASVKVPAKVAEPTAASSLKDSLESLVKTITQSSVLSVPAGGGAANEQQSQHQAPSRDSESRPASAIESPPLKQSLQGGSALRANGGLYEASIVPEGKGCLPGEGQWAFVGREGRGQHRGASGRNANANVEGRDAQIAWSFLQWHGDADRDVVLPIQDAAGHWPWGAEGDAEGHGRHVPASAKAAGDVLSELCPARVSADAR
eukprot:CAMPEP_0117545496 /NCGR_PEP_ID=MMETSP0784-20121206/46123_1 /TAXON_ID=39447 /ORGANISM="" /LENGTH=931 /DNA_ID=CAMNT_0005342341 /DNA_START=58 /DNA_END=2849 /DNA_ORIENTATION=-